MTENDLDLTGQVLESSVSLGIQINFYRKTGEAPIVSAYVDGRHIVTFQVGVSTPLPVDAGTSIETEHSRREQVVKQICDFPLVKDAMRSVLVKKLKESKRVDP